MADFSKAIVKTLAYEGVSSKSTGYVNHPLDRGKATNFGISYAFVSETNDLELFDKDGDKKLTPNDIKLLEFEDAVEAYKKYFWDYFDLDQLEDNKKAFLVFDAAVNHGCRGATKLLQKVLKSCGYDNVNVDGIYGPITKKALNDCSVEQFIPTFQEKRESLYRAIVTNNPSQKVFLKGWLSRIRMTNRDIAYV